MPSKGLAKENKLQKANTHRRYFNFFNRVQAERPDEIVLSAVGFLKALHLFLVIVMSKRNIKAPEKLASKKVNSTAIRKEMKYD